ncbi:MAG: hypothetical protein ACE5JJ_01340 [Nitrospinota bacterium]
MSVRRRFVMATMERKFRQAAIAYVGLGIVVVLLTLGVGVPERKAAEVRSLIPGVVAVVFLGAMIYFASAIARRSGALGRIVVFLTKVFVVTSGLRSFNFLINFFGLRVESHFGPFALHFHPSQFTFHPIFLVNALLTALIAYMLARAAWGL